jgi:hypothetical protein
MTLTFPEFWHRWPDLPGAGRVLAFDSLSEREQRECWDDLAEHCRHRIESEYLYERRLREEWPPPKRHQPQQRSTAATSAKPGSVRLSSHDPLKKIEPRLYVEALTGETVPVNGWLRCPLPDHDDTTPSFQVLQSHWRCFGCNRGGDIIKLAEALYGVEARGRGYWQLRDRILERLLWAPIQPCGVLR